ncbi:MAG: tetratricopeptide repeat protein [Verrucomicrobiota bacterium]|nr:tetratricopeptide repeat protein [Verrucomicrobiota bacterium]
MTSHHLEVTLSKLDPAPAPPSSFVQRLAGYLQSDLLRSLLLVLLGVAAHLPALSGQLIWDDRYLAQENPFIKSPLFILEVFRHHLFLDSFSPHYRPVQNLSYIMDYFLWNTNPYGFHLTNVLLHVASGLLLYFLLKRLLKTLLQGDGAATAIAPSVTSGAAFFVALLWTVHPVHSAAVDYISGRADSLAALFSCSGWFLFLQARSAQVRWVRGILIACALLAGLLALGSRETAALWLLLFLLYHLGFEKTMGRRARALLFASCVCLFAAYLGLRHLPEQRPGHDAANDWSKPMRAVLMLRALGDYGRLMLFPTNLYMERTLLRGDNYRNQASWEQSAGTEYLSIGGLAVLAALFSACKRGGPAQRLRIFGAGWFLLAYLPTSNIVSLNATVAEHWLYLPSIGLLLFLAGCALDLPARWRKGLAAGASCAVLALSVRSAIRSADWLTQEIFYQRTLAAGGAGMRVTINLALLYSSRGEYAKAEALCRQVLAVMPDYPMARNNLAHVLSRQGKLKEAEELFVADSKAAEQARKESPRTWIAACNLARLRHFQKNDQAAFAILDQAQKDYPEIWELISYKAEILRESKGPDAALQVVEDFARANWWHYGAAVALGRLYAQKGDVPRAETALRRASWLDVHDAEALNLIASMSLRQNRLDDAYRTQRRAVARQPDQPRQYALLSNILEKMGRPAEAKLASAEVARLESLARLNGSLVN